MNAPALLDEVISAGKTPELADVLFAAKTVLSREEAFVLWGELFPEMLEVNKETLIKLMQFAYSAGQDVGIRAGKDMARQEYAREMSKVVDKAFDEGVKSAERLRNGLST